MNTITKEKSQIYNISSNTSVNGTFKSQVFVSLPDLNFSSDSIQNVYLSVLHCEVPNSFYVVNYTCNTLMINSILYVIPVGNYNASTIITAIIALIPSTFGIAYNIVTNKFTWTNTTSEITINSSQSSIKNILGLGSTDISSLSKTLICPYVVNFLPLPRINFRTNAFKLANYNQSDGSSDLFLSLQNTAGQQGMINYSNQDNIKYLIQDKSLTTFMITVSDDFNNLINFNNQSWYLTFKIQIEYIEQIKITSFSDIIGKNNNIF
jgi:hypothetical protein